MNSSALTKERIPRSTTFKNDALIGTHPVESAVAPYHALTHWICGALGRMELLADSPLKAGQELDRLLGTSLFERLRGSIAYDERTSAVHTGEELLLSDDAFKAEECGRLYERTLRESARTKQGSFYTPPTLARRMVQVAGEEWCQDPASSRALDPACGGGVFLLALFRHLMAHPTLTSLSQPGRARFILEHMIFGVDRDPLALEIARVALTLEYLRQTASSPAELSAQPLELQLLLGDTLLAEDLFAEHSFNLVIGNPPYGLARGERIGDHEKALLTARYREWSSGKLNKFLLFIARGHELLAPSGTLVYVVPNSWLGIKNGLAVREKLLRAGHLRRVLQFREQPFTEPGVEVVIVALEKARKETFTVERWESTTAENSLQSIEYECARSAERHEAFIPLQWSNDLFPLFEALAADSLPLGSPKSRFRPMIALQAYALGEGVPPQSAVDIKSRIYDRTTRENEASVPYLDGREIRPFATAWGGTYLQHGPWLAEPQRRERFCGPRIALREILLPPPHAVCAVYLEDEFLYNKSVLHILPRSPVSRVEWRALLALLHSPIASFFFRFFGRKTQRRLFPKLVLQDLVDFPLPRSWNRFVPELSEVGAELLHAAQRHENPLRAPQFERLTELAWRCYGLSTSQIAEITSELGRSPGRGD